MLYFLRGQYRVNPHFWRSAFRNTTKEKVLESCYICQKKKNKLYPRNVLYIYVCIYLHTIMAVWLFFIFLNFLLTFMRHVKKKTLHYWRPHGDDEWKNRVHFFFNANKRLLLIPISLRMTDIRHRREEFHFWPSCCAACKRVQTKYCVRADKRSAVRFEVRTFRGSLMVGVDEKIVLVVMVETKSNFEYLVYIHYLVRH